MMGVGLVLGRRPLFERELDRKRGLAGGEAGSVGDPEDVGVDRDGRLAKGDVHDHARGLAPDPGQRFERLALARHRTRVAFDQDPAQRDQILRLGAKKADRADQPGHPLLAQRQHLLRRVGQREQRRGGLVDPGIGRLRRQHHRRQKRERVDEFELGLRDRPGFGQPPVELRNLAFRHGAHGRRV